MIGFLSWLRKLFRFPRKTTVLVAPRAFGTPQRAEFYAFQLDPARSDGEAILVARAPKEVYLVPRPLLTASHIASVDVVDVAPQSVVKRVQITLTPQGRAAVQGLTTLDHPLALVWKNEAQYVYAARAFDTQGAITVAEGLGADDAQRLKAALK